MSLLTAETPTVGQRLAEIERRTRRRGRIGYWSTRGEIDRHAAWAKRSAAKDPLAFHLRTAFHSTRKNAGKRTIPFNLKMGDVLSIFHAQGGRCSVSHVQFSLEKINGASRRPFAPSIDRIDSTKGYVKGNIRIVCVAVNLAMNEWGERVLEIVARGMLGRK